MPVVYEWDIESWFWNEYDEREILDHHHADRLSDLPELKATETLVLVRDDDNIGGDRLWAYVIDGKLPDHFEDSQENETDVRVPIKYRKEFERSKFAK